MPGPVTGGGAAGGGGVTNSAGENVLAKGDAGGNLVASQLSDTGSQVIITRPSGAFLAVTGGGGGGAAVDLVAEDAGGPASLSLSSPDGGVALEVLDTAAELRIAAGLIAGFILRMGAESKFTLAQTPSNDWSIGFIPSDAFIDAISGDIRIASGGGVVTIGDPADQGGGNYIAMDDGAAAFIVGNTNGTDPDIEYFRVFAGVATVQKAYQLTPLAFASLPTPAEGMMAWVNDSNTAVWGATIAGGGSDKVLAVYNGTNWTVAGK